MCHKMNQPSQRGRRLLTARRCMLLLALAAAAGLPRVAPGAEESENGVRVSTWRVYIGTYTGGKSRGIYVTTMDLATGALEPVKLAAESENPSFVAIHPNQQYLYAVNETTEFRGKESGGMSAFAINADTGMLTLLNQQPSGGGAPCHLVVDKTGKHVLVANYMGGNVASLPIRSDGQLGEATSLIQHTGSSLLKPRQAGPHAHSINLDSANRFAFAADLGLDQVLVYRFDAATGKLTAHDPPSVSVKPGAGPRHYAFHPTGKYAYVINEIDLTVTVFDYDARRGALTATQTITTLADGVKGLGLSTAEVRVHPSGRFLYGSNRGHDTIVVYSIDQATGKLTYVEHQSTQGRTPRNFFVEPTGTYLLAENQSTDTIVVFRINQETGELTPTGHKVDCPSPVCIRVMPISG